MRKKSLYLYVLLSLVCVCLYGQQVKSYITEGVLEEIDTRLRDVIDINTKAEVISRGYQWSEGPLWVGAEQMLLFSDVPANAIYKWTEAKGAEIYLQPSGYTGHGASKSRESGSNGLLLDKDGFLVLCQHGDRRMAKMTTRASNPRPEFLTLAGNYNGLPFNSPNDAAYNNNGVLFFTDPPYGLPTQGDADPDKKIPFNGVYRLDTKGAISLLSDKISRPNGVAVFPNQKKILVANSDPRNAVWYTLDAEGKNEPEVFYAADRSESGVKGLPDGLKIRQDGVIFATGPGGIWIFMSDATLLGKIKLTEPASNVALSDDGKTLYVTNNFQILRVRLK